jgi:hypothetical protein
MKYKQESAHAPNNYGEKASLNVRIMGWVHDTFVQQFGYFKIAGVVLACVLILVWIAYVLSSSPTRLYAEDCIIEWLSFGCWIAAMLICFLALLRHDSRDDRLVFWWFFLICALAAARELDAQVLLNPKYLGQFGVHYRPNWFLLPEVHILIRLFWFSLFLMLGGIIISPLIVLRKSILRLIRRGDVAAGLFLLSVIGLATGFVFDDTLRRTTFLDRDLRQAIEEIAELLGAAYFLLGTGSLLWKPLSEREGS